MNETFIFADKKKKSGFGKAMRKAASTISHGLMLSPTKKSDTEKDAAQSRATITEYNEGTNPTPSFSFSASSSFANTNRLSVQQQQQQQQQHDNTFSNSSSRTTSVAAPVAEAQFISGNEGGTG